MMAAMMLVLTACTTKQQTASEDVMTREQLTFPVGDKIDNPAFTGDAYLKNMIALDSVFNFPQTNNVTFAPGSHSS